MINNFIIASNPFFTAYSESDLLGKLIFIGLITLSIMGWIVLLHKVWQTRQARSNSADFQKKFTAQKLTPLNLPLDPKKEEEINPFLAIYSNLKRTTVELLNKNQTSFKSGGLQVDPIFETRAVYLSPADVSYVEGHLVTTINNQVKFLEKNLFILATIVTLGPFIGLLGTVWGILTTFSEMTAGAGGNHAFLAGLSLALATTVLGIVAAIPALIGYNYLKNDIAEFEVEMGEFAHLALSSIEFQYRKVDVQ